MSTIAFVLVFVLLGLGVLFFALSGGRGGLGSVMHSQSRGGRKFAVVGFGVALLLLGVIVPAAVIAQIKDRNDRPHAALRNLTADEKTGQELFGRRCSLCHSLKASNAVAAVGPNLDDLSPNYKLVLTTIKNGKAEGNGQMAANIYTGKEAEDVAKYVAKAVGNPVSSGG
jgi:mono/diheme cytochrome c family protein